jgi:glycosyltransferase involved in cell wall biosynthesis
VAEPLYTLAICTRDRPAALERCLRSVVEVGHRPAQVLVADDGDGRAAEVVARFPDLEIQVLQGPRRGLAANRNVCVRAAASPLLLFLDDDARLNQGFLALALPLSGEGRIVTGFEWQGGVRVRARNPSFFGYMQVEPKDSSDIRSITINSTLFPTGLLRARGFLEFYRYGYEELDLALWARSQGVEIRYVDEGNFHDRDPSQREGYSTQVVESNGYLGVRRYVDYERRPLTAVVFSLLGTARQALAGLRRGGPAGALSVPLAFLRGVTAGWRDVMRGAA